MVHGLGGTARVGIRPEDPRSEQNAGSLFRASSLDWPHGVGVLLSILDVRTSRHPANIKHDLSPYILSMELQQFLLVIYNFGEDCLPTPSLQHPGWRSFHAPHGPR